MSASKQITMQPVGYVRTKAVGEEVKDKTRISKIIVYPEFEAALRGVADYSHLYVLFWMSEIPQEKKMLLQVHPRGRNYLPLAGAFAVRTNLRPNPIGLTVVELLNVARNVLTVRGLDAFDDTPILDIKPYDLWDIAKDVRVPHWWTELEQERQTAAKNYLATR